MYIIFNRALFIMICFEHLLFGKMSAATYPKSSILTSILIIIFFLISSPQVSAEIPFEALSQHQGQ